MVWLAMVLVLLAAPSARAAYDPIASGVTVLKLDKVFLGLLRAHGVRVTTREGASFKGGALRFPAAGGKFDPLTRKGTVEHDGKILFRRGNRIVPLKDLQLKTTRRSSPFVGRVGGGQLKLGAARRLSVARQGFGERVTVSGLRLSAKVATRLSRRLRLEDVFEPGMAVGSFVTRTSPATVTILGKGAAEFEFDPAMAAKLDELHVALSPIFPAEHRGPFTLPIFSGKLALDLHGDFLQLQGGLELLQLGGGQVVWRDPILDLGNGFLAPREEEAVASLSLAAGATAEDPKERTLAVTGAVLTLPGSTAALFEQIFAENQGKSDIFHAGEILGRLSFLAEAQ
jgi:hypothetical protein